MPNVETAHDKAVQRIAEQEGRIARQERLIVHLDRDGHSSEAARELLTVMEDSLSVLRSSLTLIPN